MQPFEITYRDLKPGSNHFDWRADGEFFRSFGNQDIVGADIAVAVDADNVGGNVRIECSLKGYVVVLCDRCLGELKIDVETGFVEEETLDLSQDIYDYVCVSLPLQKVHPDGECDKETIKYLKTE